MSAPAAAWLTAVLASRGNVGSLSTAPSGISTPQWPWLMYSQRQTSVMTMSLGQRSLRRRTACCTMPSSA